MFWRSCLVLQAQMRVVSVRITRSKSAVWSSIGSTSNATGPNYSCSRWTTPSAVCKSRQHLHLCSLGGLLCAIMYFFLIRFWSDSFRECPEYLQEHGQNVGCRIPLEDSQRFGSFYTKLSVGGNQLICKNYTDLRSIGKRTSEGFLIYCRCH